MKAERIKEFLCVAVLVVFVALLTGNSSVSKKSADDVFASVRTFVPDEKASVKKADERKIKKQFGLDANEFDGMSYCVSDSVMEVRELLVVKLKNKSQQHDVEQTLEDYVEKKAELFKGYAPEQSAQLEKYVLICKKGMILFAVCDEPDKLVAAFGKAV